MAGGASADKEEYPPISFIELYRFATIKERIMIYAGIASGIVTALVYPCHVIIFGNLADVMITYGASLASGQELDVDAFLEGVDDFTVKNTILGFLMLVCSYLSIMLFKYAAHNQIFRIRRIFFRSILNQEMAWFDSYPSGSVSSRMNEDISKLEEGIGEKVVSFFHFSVAFLACVTLALIKGWQLALVCVCSIPASLIFMAFVAAKTTKYAKQVSECYAKAGSVAEEAITAIKTVVAFGGEDKEARRYKANLVHAKRATYKKAIFSGLGFALAWFFVYAGFAVAFWYGTELVINQKSWDAKDIVYTPGVMFTVFLSVLMSSMNITRASLLIQSFAVAKVAGARIYGVIDRVPKINPNHEEGHKPPKLKGNINFVNVVFRYPCRPDAKVLEGLDLTIKKGETVALVGSSGSGKSTCVKLLQRLYDPISGDIYLDDYNIKLLNVNWLRRRIAVVTQEPVLFDTTIYENIRYGRTEATREDIVNAAKAANAHVFINKLPDEYDTIIGQNGDQLSGGQKQRIAIARALVKNPAILIFDEATSALDNVGEARVQAALEKASRGRTTIIVAQRFSTIRGADRIVVIDQGRVVENGTHLELMALYGHYYNLVVTQISVEKILQLPTFPQIPSHFNTNFNIVQPVNVEPEDESPLVESPYRASEDQKWNRPEVSFGRLLKMNSPEWHFLLGGSISATIMGLSMPIYGVLFGSVMGSLSSSDVKQVREETNTYCIYFLIAGLAIGSATFFQVFCFDMSGEKLTDRLRAMAFRAMLKQEIAWFQMKGTGTLCARLSNEAATVQAAIGPHCGTILQTLSTMTLCICLAMYYEWRLGLIALVFSPMLLIATFVHQKVVIEEYLSTTAALETSTQLAIEAISNIETVAGLTKERMFYNRYVELLKPSVEKARKITHYRGLAFAMGRSLIFFAFSACMFYGGRLVAYHGLFYAQVFKVSQALVMGSIAIANAFAYTPNMQKGFAAARRMIAMMARKSKVKDPPGSIGDLILDPNGDIRYDEAHFSYPRRSIPILRELKMHIAKGQTVALVGPSGCGKSTCVQLLLRFYDIERGSISINDTDIRDVSLSSLRENFGLVTQEPYFFARTISENIAYGDNKRVVPQAEIIEAAKKANIHKFIISLKMGYLTKLGRRGAQLSAGQRQRIAIARALIRNPKILVLDEATSALDAENEQFVQEAIKTATKGRTCILVAHRLSSIVNSDVIFVLTDGNIVESGTHDELLALGGVYYNLYRLQNGADYF